MKKYHIKSEGTKRIEHDLLGDKEVPAEALYGVQTLRCIENFDISRQLLSDYPQFIKAFGMVKMAAVLANHRLGLIDTSLKDAIVAACQELIDGKHTEQFPVDMIHPNDHVNMAQSTNDAYPTAMHLGLYMVHLDVKAALEKLIDSFAVKETEFAKVIKMGRTQLQDAVPMTLGQSFGAFASAMRHELKHLENAAKELLIINMGATAIGTGITAEPGYAEACTQFLKEITGWKIKLADNLIEATHDTSPMVSYSSALKMIAIRLSKICNDLRLMSSGPRTGLAEINLPPKQPGSSIMPGKVNPVIPEVVNQVCFRVIGNDLTITMASEAAQLELNVMEPVLVHSLVESSLWLKRAFDTLRVECIDGITANADHCRYLVEHSVGIVTALKPFIGYTNSTEIAKEALESGCSVYQLVLDKQLLTKEQLDKILDPANMIRPVKITL
jgi:aspartate ammonia-lyase